MRKYLFVLIALITASGLFANGSSEASKASADSMDSADPGEVNVYSHRHYEADQELFDAFTAETGIKVNVVKAKADELIERMRSEGAASPADVLITVDAGRLTRAENLGLLQSVSSAVLDGTVPSKLRDPEGHWYALTKRARVIVYDKQVMPEPGVSTYAELADPDLGADILIRSSSNIYNISLLASMVNREGEAAAKAWAEGVVGNMARDPQGNDRDQMRALVAGEGDYAVVNTYYVGLLLNADDPADVKVGERIGLIFPDQDGAGTHVNISGAGVAANAPNPENALRLIEFLVSEEAQEVFSKQNHEYPVNPKVEPSGTAAMWGTFVEDGGNVAALGDFADRAVRIFDEAGWR